MSGGGGGTGIGPPGGQPDEVDCTAVRFETSLAGPQPDVVDRLSEDHVLDVDLHEEENRPRLVARYEGAEAGALTERTTTLLRCIQDGARFKATVLEIDGGIVRVRVEYDG